MEDNPYRAFLDVVRTEAAETAPTGLCLGVVTSPSPLKVLTGGNTLEAGELLAAAHLLAGETAAVRAELAGSLEIDASCPAGSHSAAGVTGGALAGTITRTAAGFRAGDRLLMLPIEEAQRYIIICKVVEL